MSVVAGAFPPEVAGRPAGGEAPAGPTEVPIVSLRVCHHLRSAGLDEHHVRSLAELEGRWPALVVWAEHPEVVLDGAHRLAAARRLGYPSVRVEYFHGTSDEAFVEALRRNVAHGLPLSIADRLRAGQQVLRRHPDWSDRRIAETCALSARTVARLRAALAPATAGEPNRDSEAESKKRVAASLEHGGPSGSARLRMTVSEGPPIRVGKDGRCRPAQQGVARTRVEEALQVNPGASLRQIAKLAGVSPETVRRVRRELGQPGDTSSRSGATPVGLWDGARRSLEGRGITWRKDPALSGDPALADLLSWLERTDPEEDWARFAPLVPLSRVYELADDARRRASAWTSFAQALEERARRRSRSFAPG